MRGVCLPPCFFGVKKGHLFKEALLGKFLFLTLLVLCTFAVAVRAAVKDVIPAGTILQCTMNSCLSEDCAGW